MNSEHTNLKPRRPEVKEAHEFLEIVQDFTDPREAIREAISNSVDWGATKIDITISEDGTRPDEELIVEIKDNGIGLNEERLEAFFNLGHTTWHSTDSPGSFELQKIGCKGHGTKTYFNARQIEVWSDSRECSVYAIMDDPLQKLMDDEVPEYRYAVESKHNSETSTRITIRGYNMSQNRDDFAHEVLEDYIVWFTRFGSVEQQLGISENRDKVLHLQGLGRDKPSPITFGHRFPQENCNITQVRKQHPGDWTKHFVKKWVFKRKPVLGHPSKFIDIVFYIEGNLAKRDYNPMVRFRKTPQYGTYKVEERYGLWVAKDYIPIKLYNNWLGLGKRLETKYHAFVNCQDFRLTANRGDIGNTPADLLTKIEETVRQVFEDEIRGSDAYQEYEEAAELDKQYQTAQQELKDFNRRSSKVKKTKICAFQGIELIEPRLEMGVIALFNLVYAHEPSLFPFRVVDYDSKRGYDALVAGGQTPHDLTGRSMKFVEFKHTLSPEFNHSFGNLSAIICWDCALDDGAQLRDIKDEVRKLQISPPEEAESGRRHTCYMLMSSRQLYNIEVFVLKDFLREKLELEFRPRAANPSD